MLSFINYNITADYFDKPGHTWSERKDAVVNILKNSDIAALQELTPQICSDLYDSLQDYDIIAINQHPSDCIPGAIYKNSEVKQLIGKYTGTPLIGYIVKKSIQILVSDCFFLNEKPYELPIHKDRGTTDKGFGNFNTYRCVFHIQVLFTDKKVHLFNAHYPLSGGSLTRTKCAELQMREICKITNDFTDKFIISGDFNNFTDNTVTLKDYDIVNSQVYTCKDTYNALISSSKYRDLKINCDGTTFIGFSYDNYKTDIVDGVLCPKNDNILDLVISNIPSDSTECGLGLYGDWKKREYASDHTYQLAKFII